MERYGRGRGPECGGCGRDSSAGCGERYIYGRSGGAGCGMESVCSRSGGTGFVRREAFKDKPAGVRGVGYFKRFVQEVERVFYSTKIFLELDRSFAKE